MPREPRLPGKNPGSSSAPAGGGAGRSQAWISPQCTALPTLALHRFPACAQVPAHSVVGLAPCRGGKAKAVPSLFTTARYSSHFSVLLSPFPTFSKEAHPFSSLSLNAARVHPLLPVPAGLHPQPYPETQHLSGCPIFDSAPLTPASFSLPPITAVHPSVSFRTRCRCFLGLSSTSGSRCFGGKSVLPLSL